MSVSSDMSSHSISSTDVTAIEQSYVFPHAITAIASTSTKFGISMKDIIGLHASPSPCWNDLMRHILSCDPTQESAGVPPPLSRPQTPEPKDYRRGAGRISHSVRPDSPRRPASRSLAQLSGEAPCHFVIEAGLIRPPGIGYPENYHLARAARVNVACVHLRTGSLLHADSAVKYVRRAERKLQQGAARIYGDGPGYCDHGDEADGAAETVTRAVVPVGNKGLDRRE